MTRQQTLVKAYANRRTPAYIGKFRPVMRVTTYASAAVSCRLRIDKLKAVVLDCTQSVKKRVLCR